MPQQNPRTEIQRVENLRNDSARSERSRSEKPARASYAISAPLGQTAAGVNAGLRVQKQMFDVFEGISREWVARAAAKAELACKLPNNLTAAGSIPDALSAYQEWLGEWLNTFGEDGRRVISDSQKILDTGMRCFIDVSPVGTS